jgi:uncharacterized protein
MTPLYVSKSSIAGKGLFVGKPVKKGETIAFIKGTLKRKTVKTKAQALSSPNLIGIGRGLWIDPKQPYKYINHSCEPSAGIQGTVTLIALRDMKTGEEITLDYGTTEEQLRWEMVCGCGSKNCRKLIRSIQALPRERFDAYLPCIPTYFKRLYMNIYGINHDRREAPWNNVYIAKSPIHGSGVFAARDIEKGERIYVIKGDIKTLIVRNKRDSARWPNCIGVDHQVWINPVPPSTHLNHSCNPNAGIKGRVTLTALKKIKKGEEITFDYSISEDDQLWVFDCNCGDPNCRGRIYSIQSLPEHIFKKYLPAIPRYFQKTYLRYNKDVYDR